MTLSLKSDFIKNYLAYLLLFISIFILYAFFLHELAHFIVCDLSGNMGTLFVGFSPRFTCHGNFNSSALLYWLFNAAPYLFVDLLVVIACSLALRRARNPRFRQILIIVLWLALMDSLSNLFTFFVPPNDFYNLFTANRFFFGFGGLLILLIVLVSKFWIQEEWRAFAEAGKRVGGKGEFESGDYLLTGVQIKY